MPVSGIQAEAELMWSMGGRHKVSNHTDKSTIVNSGESHERKAREAGREMKGETWPNPR